MTRWMWIAAAVSFTALPPLAAQVLPAHSFPAPRPVAPVTVGGACPFECCRYGKWTLSDPATIRRRPNLGAPALFHLATRTKVFADTGLVRIDTVGIVVMRRDYRDPGYSGLYQKGDTLLILDYLGEGFTHGWWRGRDIQTTIFWYTDPPPHPDSAAGQLVRSVSEQWWARVRDPRGRIGWMDMSRVGVFGADACA